MTSHVEEAVRARIQAAKRRTENMLRQRAELAAARRRGLAARHAQKLRNQASRQQEPTDLHGADGNAGTAQTDTSDEAQA